MTAHDVFLAAMVAAVVIWAWYRALYSVYRTSTSLASRLEDWWRQRGHIRNQAQAAKPAPVPMPAAMAAKASPSRKS